MHYRPRYALNNIQSQICSFSSLIFFYPKAHKGETLEETLQVGRQWPDKQIPLGARRPICRLQIANVAPVLDVLPFV